MASGAVHRMGIFPPCSHTNTHTQGEREIVSTHWETLQPYKNTHTHTRAQANANFTDGLHAKANIGTHE